MAILISPSSDVGSSGLGQTENCEVPTVVDMARSDKTKQKQAPCQV